MSELVSSYIKSLLSKNLKTKALGEICICRKFSDDKFSFKSNFDDYIIKK